MLLEAKNINVSFKKEKQKTIFGKERQQVVKNVSLSLKKRECLGIIGESGSGKSTLGKTLIGLLKPDNGKIYLDGIDMYNTTREKRKKIQQMISIVFQDYTSSTNPRFLVKDIIEESLRTLEKKLGKRIEKESKIKELLETVGLDESYMGRYPHELSGGQLQRVCIARAIATEPQFILLDEAISSLDASTQTQVMDLLKDLQNRYNLSYIFITHDLPSVTYMCDRVLFFYEGEVVEEVDDIYKLSKMKSPYAKKLLNSVLEIKIDE